MREQLKAIIRQLDAPSSHTGEPLLLLPRKAYQPLPLSKDRFSPLPTDATLSSLVFVDGGSTVVYHAADTCVGFLRIGALTFSGKRHVGTRLHEGFIVVRSIMKEGQLHYSTQWVTVQGDALLDTFILDSLDATLTTKGARASITQAIDVARRFAELQLAATYTDEYVVVDGLLMPTLSGEEALLAQLSSRTFGLAKTCRLFTDHGQDIVSYLAQLRQMCMDAPGAWWYGPVAKNASHMLLFAKLHPASAHLFSLEAPVQDPAQVSALLATLASHACDAVFPGYPYGLIQVDRCVRVSNREKSYLQTLFWTLAGEKTTQLRTKAHALDAHSILDTIG